MSTYWNNTYPPFPSDIPTAPLQKIRLGPLISGDRAESRALFEACQGWGFFLLDLRGCEQGEALLGQVERVFGISREFFDLGIEEKKGPGRNAIAYGYKAVGLGKVDKKGTPDRCEFVGLSKDGFMGLTDLDYVPAVLQKDQAVLSKFIKDCHSICMTILSQLERNLHLPPHALQSLHNLSSRSTDQLRLLKTAPQPEEDKRTSLLPHTDFGSVTLLWNILGGLQVQRPSAATEDEGWEFVRPEPGCVIINMGDSMTCFSNGIVRSSLHRVTYAPGEQNRYDRYSIAYFSRPNDETPMEALSGVERNVLSKQSFLNDEGGVPSAKEWVEMRTKLYRNGGAPTQGMGGTVAPVPA